MESGPHPNSLAHYVYTYILYIPTHTPIYMESGPHPQNTSACRPLQVEFLGVLIIFVPFVSGT